jgi:hypothetical protein
LHRYSYSSSFPIPMAFRAHSTASLRSQKYSRMNVRTISRAETAELLLQSLSCRSQGVLRQDVSGKRCLRLGSNVLGAAARRLLRKPVCARCKIPETMLMMAMILGLEDCLYRKARTAGDSGEVEKEPGMKRMSNTGAFSKEFWNEELAYDSVFWDNARTEGTGKGTG